MKVWEALKIPESRVDEFDTKLIALKKRLSKGEFNDIALILKEVISFCKTKEEVALCAFDTGVS